MGMTGDIRTWSPEAIILMVLAWSAAILIAGGLAFSIFAFSEWTRRRWGPR